MAAPQQRRFPLPRSNLGAVSETPAGMIPSDQSDAGDSSGAGSPSDSSAPARGREMRANLLSKLRAPPLVHTWDFWHDKPDPNAESASPAAAAPSGVPFGNAAGQDRAKQQNQNYQPILTHLLTVSDIKTFWSLFNNFDFGTLPQHSSVHLFHTTVKPVWEDPRNIRGGAWTFRVPRAAAVDFWQNICMLAIGEQLQEAVRSERVTFRDDICGVSFRPRFTSVLVTIWNRDGTHEEGIKRLAETVVQNMPEHLTPKEGSYYYKKHSDHPGFDQDMAKKNLEAAAPEQQAVAQQLSEAEQRHDQVKGTVDEMTREMDNVRRALERVEVGEDEMASKLDSPEATA